MDMSKIESWPKPELLWPVRCHPAVLCRVSVLCRHASPHCWWWAGWDWEQSHLAHNSLPVRMRRDNNAILITCLQVCSENKAALVEEVFCQIWWVEYSMYDLVFPFIIWEQWIKSNQQWKASETLQCFFLYTYCCQDSHNGVYVPSFRRGIPVTQTKQPLVSGNGCKSYLNSRESGDKCCQKINGINIVSQTMDHSFYHHTACQHSPCHVHLMSMFYSVFCKHNGWFYSFSITDIKSTCNLLLQMFF